MNRVALNQIVRISVALYIFLFSFVLAVTAQVAPDLDSEYSITMFEAPQGAGFGFEIDNDTLLFLKKNELIRLDEKGKQLESVPIGEIDTRAWTFGGGSVWILGKSKSFAGIHRIDPRSGKLMDTIAFDRERDQAISYAYGSLWIWTTFVLAKGKPLLRIDPETKHVTVVDAGGPFKGQLGFNDGKVWLLGIEDGVVKCLDPESNKVVDEFSVGREHDNAILKQSFKGGSYSYAIDDGIIWVGNHKGAKGDIFILSGFDLKTHERIAKLESDDALWGPVIWKGNVWLSIRGDPRKGHYISKIDPKLKHTVGRIFIPGGSESDFVPPVLVPGRSQMHPGRSQIPENADFLWALSGNPWNRKTPVIVRRIQTQRTEGEP